MKNSNPINRRNETRMPLQGLNLKIRKTGFGTGAQYETCRSIDLSQNGLAFTSPNIELAIPEKIDFILQIEEHEIKGSGVICNQRQQGDLTQYGMMFLAVSPEISSVFDYDVLNTAELKALAGSLAEQFVYNSLPADKPLNKLVLRKQQQLFDAIRAYLLRLGEMGVRLPDPQSGKLSYPVRSIKVFMNTEHAMLIRWRDAQNHPQQIKITLENTLGSGFVVNDDQHCKNVLHVLECLGQALKTDVRFA